MENFFTNFFKIASQGNYFIKNKISDLKEKDNNLLSFAIILGLIIGFFHVISILMLVPAVKNIQPVGLAFLGFIAAWLYLGIVFTKSAVFYYLTGMADKSGEPVSARKIFKINIMSSYPFLMLPAFGIISSLLNSMALFTLLYLCIFIWAAVNKYKMLKFALKMDNYIFKLTYIIPILVQIALVVVFISIGILSNLIILKTVLENIIKTIAAALKSFAG